MKVWEVLDLKEEAGGMGAGFGRISADTRGGYCD